MAAPKGNNFWELRSKHGRDKLFATPELMWEAACEYFDWCIENPLMRSEQSKGRASKKSLEVDKEGVKPKDTGIIEIPLVRPFTIEGLCHYLDCNKDYFNHFYNNVRDKDEDLSKGFTRVITRIRETIYRQKFEGATVNAFNANIIARDLGLADKKEIKGTKIKVTLKDK